MVTAAGGSQLNLQAAAALGKVDEGNELCGGHLDAAMGEHGRQGGRAALLSFLGKERDLTELALGRRSLSEVCRNDRRCRGAAQE